MTFRDAPQETETPAPGPFGVPPEYFGPPDGETALRADEMHANRIETEAMGALRIALHDPQTGFASRPPTERLAALPELQATLDGIGETFRAQATTPRQQAILGPLLDNHLEHAATQVGRLAEQALAEADDGIVETRIGGLQRDAAVNWDDPARLRILGRAIVTERRAQGERKSWDKDQTETRVRHNVSDFYATAIEAATDRDLDRAGKLLADAQGVLLPDRLSMLARKLAEARNDKHVAGIAGTLAAIPLDPASAPLPETYRARAEELTPEDASPELRARIAQLADTAQRHATKYWQHDRNQAGLAAIDWMLAHPGAPVVTMDRKVVSQLAPEQLARLQQIETIGRLDTDPEVYKRLDRMAVYDPKTFAATDLSRYRLTLDGTDYRRFTSFQKGEAGFTRYDRGRTVLDAGLTKASLDLDGPEARAARGELDKTLRSFETIEGQPPTMADIDRIAGTIVRKATGIPEVEQQAEAPTAPTPGSAEYEGARRQSDDLERRPLGSSLDAAALAVGAGSTAEAIPHAVTKAAQTIGTAAVRAAPAIAASAVAAAPAALLSIPLMLYPMNSQGDTVALTDGLRMRRPPGQRYVDIERRVDTGLFGTGVMAKWERVPVDAEYGTASDGRQTLLVDPNELKSAIGAEAMDRLLATPGVDIIDRTVDRSGADAGPATPDPSDDSYIERLIRLALGMQIGITNIADKKVIVRKATAAEATEYCSNYPNYKQIFDTATAKADLAGISKGLTYGRTVHHDIDINLREDAIRRMLNAQGAVEVHAEQAFLNGLKKSYRMKGSSVPDVVELNERTKTICIYEFKTGKATLNEPTIRRYGGEGVAISKAKKWGYTQVYVIPIYEGTDADRP